MIWSCRRMPPGHGLSDREERRVRPDDGVGRRQEESMSYRGINMIDAKELLRRWSAGQSNRQIARATGADRDTVARYVGVATALGFERGHEFSDEQVSAIAQRVQAKAARDPSAEWQEVAM